MFSKMLVCHDRAPDTADDLLMSCVFAARLVVCPGIQLKREDRVWAAQELRPFTAGREKRSEKCSVYGCAAVTWFFSRANPAET